MASGLTGEARHQISDPDESAGDDLPAGTTLCFGQYEILEYLNSGGFGITYLALDSLGRKVVIKECFPAAMCRRSGRQVSLRAAGYDLDFDRVVELFEREARALAQLEHPSIVGVHHIFKDNGTAYMALDFVEGLDLLRVLEETPRRLSAIEIRRITFLLLHALSYVHRNGILHRDISPDNILLGQDGNPVLIDFGAAREDATRASRILSRVQTVKDGYSPQEFYLASGSQEVPSDLYALAATIHHLITGAPPPNSTVRLSAVAENQADPYVPLEGRVSGYDQHFLRAIDRCLSVFSRDRLKSAEAWLDMIDETRRRKALAEKAKADQDLERTISQLIVQNRDVKPGCPGGDDRQRAEREAAEAAAAEAKRAAEREYWAILNEDCDLSDDYDFTEDYQPAEESGLTAVYEVEPPQRTASAAPEPDHAAHAPARPRPSRAKRRVSALVMLWGLMMVGPLDDWLASAQLDRVVASMQQTEGTH